jgi:hypothetical protein
MIAAKVALNPNRQSVRSVPHRSPLSSLLLDLTCEGSRSCGRAESSLGPCWLRKFVLAGRFLRDWDATLGIDLGLSLFIGPTLHGPHDLDKVALLFCRPAARALSIRGMSVELPISGVALNQCRRRRRRDGSSLNHFSFYICLLVDFHLRFNPRFPCFCIEIVHATHQEMVQIFGGISAASRGSFCALP